VGGGAEEENLQADSPLMAEPSADEQLNLMTHEIMT